ncbi:DUF6318 family protein [Kocuria sp. cx-455]|uniref:DUF6318 family protein n=1 Tax=Kocuria sp. cx-455 TaxID=2771377 RepID=UPI003D74394D
MGDALKRSKFAASLAALALGLTLAGCGDTNNPGSEGTATTVDGSSSPSTGETGAESSDSPASTPDPSASGDWWPEQPDKMATGQEFPDDYEPASLEHPARNVPKPVMPEEAKQETEAGAQAFLDYRTDAVWYAFQTGDTQFAREVTSEHCEKCLDELDRIDAIYGSGDWLAGGLERAKILGGAFSQGADGIYSLPVQLDSSGVKVFEEGELTSQQRPYSTDSEFNGNLIFKDKKWKYVTASPRSS